MKSLKLGKESNKLDIILKYATWYRDLKELPDINTVFNCSKGTNIKVDLVILEKSTWALYMALVAMSRNGHPISEMEKKFNISKGTGKIKKYFYNLITNSTRQGMEYSLKLFSFEAYVD